VLGREWVAVPTLAPQPTVAAAVAVVQNAVPLARLPPDDCSVLMLVCSTQLPVALASGFRFIDTPSVPDSDEGYV
jgi:hypothetical protein